MKLLKTLAIALALTFGLSTLAFADDHAGSGGDAKPAKKKKAGKGGNEGAKVGKSKTQGKKGSK